MFGLGELTDEFVRRADVQALMPLVSVQISAEPDPGYPGAALTDQVTDAGSTETGLYAASWPISRKAMLWLV